MAIADKLTQLNNVKLAIKQGLQSKLDLNLSNTAFTDYATQINTITNQGAVTKTFTPSTSSQSYTIPKGYHNGSGKVTCNAITTKTQSVTNSGSASANSSNNVTYTFSNLTKIYGISAISGADEGGWLKSFTISGNKITAVIGNNRNSGGPWNYSVTITAIGI